MTEKKDILRLVSDTLAGYKFALAGPEMPGLAWSIELLDDYFAAACRARDRGEPLAWINFGMFPEIFWAMDIPPICVEVVNGLIAPSPDALRYIDLAEEHIPDYVCSSNKLHLGSVLAGDLPVPDLLVHPSKPCDSNLAEYAVLSEYFDVPYFCIDMPYFSNERSIEYIIGELKNLVAFLEQKAGHRLDYGKLRQVMEYSNTAHEYAIKLAGLREAAPSPYSSLDNLGEYPTVLSLAGTPQLADYFRDRYKLEKEKMERNENRPVMYEEKIRMAWIYGAPAFDLFFFMRLEQKHGAVAVANMNNNFIMEPVQDLSSTDSILRGLAHKLTLLPMTRECGGPWEQYLDASIDLCRRFKADAAIFAGHVACKGNWAVIKLVKDKLTEELGIPVMIVELDLFDPRVLNSDALMARFDDFIDIVLQR